MLYACDYRWWKKFKGVPEFEGLKICQDYHPELTAWGIKNVVVNKSQDRILTSDIGTIGWGGNGGFQAINLAVQFRVKKIILVGFDKRIDLGIHWHGPNKGIEGLYDPTPGNVSRWRRVIDDSAPLLLALGISVFNCSTVSSLNNYQKSSLKQALGE